MKSLIALASVLLFAYSNGKAQFKTGDVELSFFGSMGSYTYNYSNYGYSQSSTTKYLSVNASAGYYIMDGLSIEPQVGLEAVEKSDPSQSIVLNLSYTYLIPDSRIGAFAIAGYGLGNSAYYPMYNMFIRTSNKFNVDILNLGAGAKFLISRSVIIRTELNYLSNHWSEQFFSSSSDQSESNMGIPSGISILL